MKVRVYPYILILTLKSIDWTQSSLVESNSISSAMILRMKFLYISGWRLEEFYKEFFEYLKSNTLITRLLLKHIFLFNYTVVFSQNTFLRLQSNYLKYFAYIIKKDLPEQAMEDTLLRNRVYLTTVAVSSLYVLYSSQNID